MSVHALSLALRVPATRLHEIVNERRSIKPIMHYDWRVISAQMRSLG
ncbi:MAG: hypothetical protein ABL911_10180 [Gallionella sp.]